MLTPAIHQTYEAGVRALAEHNRVDGRVGEGINQRQGALFATEAADFMSNGLMSALGQQRR
jgi:2,5-dioxopentanoate dehydrogenase